jgi:hypothetical protein
VNLNVPKMNLQVRKVCIAESIFQKKLAEEKDTSDKYYLKYKHYTWTGGKR